MGPCFGFMSALFVLLKVPLTIGRPLCPEGYRRYGNKCYSVIIGVPQVDFAASRARCHNEDTLVMTDDQVELLFVKELVKNSTFFGFSYVGLSDEITENTFIWHTKFHLKVDDFDIMIQAVSDQQRPLAETNTEDNDCVAIKASGNVEVVNCADTTEVVICERPIKTGKMCGLNGERITFH